MDPFLGLAWLTAGIVIGAVLSLWLSASRHRSQMQRAKLAMADSQQRRALERLREQNNDLSAQLDASTQRQARAIEALKQTHAAEVSSLEDELKHARESLLQMMDASSKGHVISGTAFEPTQFDEGH